MCTFVLQADFCLKCNLNVPKMKTINAGIFGNNHVTTCWCQQNLESAKKKKKRIFEIWLYRSIEREKEVKVTKRPHVENQLFRSYCALSILMIKGVIQVEILHKILNKVLTKQANDSIFTSVWFHLYFFHL